MDRFTQYNEADSGLGKGLFYGNSIGECAVGTISAPEWVKAIVGVIYKDPSLFDEALARIEREFSPPDLISDAFPFIETHYYEKEMGADLTRRYLSLRDLIHPKDLPRFKVLSNQWEEELTQDGRRRVNLDPGYIGAANLILASTKNFSQRIYLSDGIYGEVTMLYQNGSFRDLPWTYPDYSHHKDVFLRMRQIYKEQLKSPQIQALMTEM